MKKGIFLLLITFLSLSLSAENRKAPLLLSSTNHFILISQISNSTAQVINEQSKPTLANENSSNWNQVAKNAILLLALLLSGSLILVLLRTRREGKKTKKDLLAQIEQLKGEVENLRKSNKSKERMFSIVAHDLRGPLATLKNILDLRESRDLSKDEFDEILPLMSKEVSRSLELTEEILSWAKSQMSNNHICLTKVNLYQILEDQVSQFESAAKSKGIALMVQKVDGECVAIADINMLKTIVRNLLANAIKFCRNNDRITLSAQKNGKATLIKVSDTGIGMSPENLSKLFGTASITTKGTSNEKGSGLGLTLCKDFVEKNNGKIWAESELGKGSTFYFTLPQL